jgi:hypothetical protein
MKAMNAAQREAYEKRVWQDRAEQESSLWERQMTQLGASNRGLVGKRVALPALTAAQLEGFLKSQSRKLQGYVLHDEALIRQPEKAGDYIQQADVKQSLTVTMDAGSRSEAAIPDRFWKLQQSIAAVFAPTPTYEQAFEQLGLDLKERKLENSLEDKNLLLYINLRKVLLYTKCSWHSVSYSEQLQEDMTESLSWPSWPSYKQWAWSYPQETTQDSRCVL